MIACNCSESKKYKDICGVILRLIRRNEASPQSTECNRIVALEDIVSICLEAYE